MRMAAEQTGLTEPMRLLLINPNTTEAMTAKVALAAGAALPGVTIIPATGRFGTRYVASHASFAVAAHAALDCFAEHGTHCDAALLACFGDPGLEALREISQVPVISLIDAACAVAGENNRRFAIVTGGERWGPMLRDILRQRRLDQNLATIRTVAPTGGQIAADPQAALDLLADTCRDCMATDGAEAVILGGAGLIGIAELIQPKLDVPVICSNQAGFNAVRLALPAGKARVIGGTDAVASTGLSPALAALFASGSVDG